MVHFDRAVRTLGGGVEYLNDPYYYCGKLGGYSPRPYEVMSCKYRQMDDTKYRVAQDRGSEKIPGKVYRWDCCVISEKCRECEDYHNPSEGEDPHKCPFGLKERRGG